MAVNDTREDEQAREIRHVNPGQWLSCCQWAKRFAKIPVSCFAMKNHRITYRSACALTKSNRTRKIFAFLHNLWLGQLTFAEVGSFEKFQDLKESVRSGYHIHYTSKLIWKFLRCHETRVTRNFIFEKCLIAEIYLKLLSFINKHRVLKRKTVSRHSSSISNW